MSFIPSDPTTWPLKVHIVGHDVGRSRDRSTAVIGGNCPFTVGSRSLGVKEFVELPVGLYGSQLANAVAEIDRAYNHDCLFVADLSNDATYGETLFDTFGRRIIGLQIGRSGDGTTSLPRQVRMALSRSITLAGPSCSTSCSPSCETVVSFLPTVARKCRALMNNLTALEVEQRESGTIYKCPSGQHDDLAMSLAMLAWAAQHLHLDAWIRPIFDAHRPRRPRQTYGWGAFT